jgi:hypothetical protein
MTLQVTNLPDRTDIIVDPGPPIKGQQRRWLITKPWINWFQLVMRILGLVPVSAGSIYLSRQSAAVAQTPTGAATITYSPFRVTWATRVIDTTAAFSVQVTVYWTADGVAFSRSFAAVTQATPSGYGTDTILISADQSTTIDYSVAYSSAPAGMTCDINIIVEDMP